MTENTEAPRSPEESIRIAEEELSAAGRQYRAERKDFEESLIAPEVTDTTPAAPKERWGRIRRFLRNAWAKRILTVTIFLLAAFGAAVWIQSIAATIEETLSGRNEFVTRCAAAGDRVYKSENTWACVRGEPVIATRVGGIGEPSIEEAEDACQRAGQLALRRVDTNDWIYCVKGEIVDSLR